MATEGLAADLFIIYICELTSPLLLMKYTSTTNCYATIGTTLAGRGQTTSFKENVHDAAWTVYGKKYCCDLVVVSDDVNAELPRSEN